MSQLFVAFSFWLKPMFRFVFFLKSVISLWSFLLSESKMTVNKLCRCVSASGVYSVPSLLNYDTIALQVCFIYNTIPTFSCTSYEVIYNSPHLTKNQFRIKSENIQYEQWRQPDPESYIQGGLTGALDMPEIRGVQMKDERCLWCCGAERRRRRMKISPHS